MKRFLTVTLMVAVLSALPLSFGMAQDGPEPPEGATQFVYLGYHHKGHPGLSYGLGFTFGKVTVLPFTRFALSDTATATNGINYEKSIGIEFVYWVVEKPNWKLGAVAGPGTVEWLEQQDQDLPQILSQSLGLAGVYYFNDNISAVLGVKGTEQLWGPESPLTARIEVLAAISGKLALF